MQALNSDFFYEIDNVTDVIRQRRKTLIDKLVGRLAVGQVLGDQFLYEVYGPYEVAPAAPARRPLLDRLIGRLKARLQDMAHQRRLHRAAQEMSRLDDRMLKDIGVTRLEIDAAVSGTPIYCRSN